MRIHALAIALLAFGAFAADDRFVVVTNQTRVDGDWYQVGTNVMQAGKNQRGDIIRRLPAGAVVQLFTVEEKFRIRNPPPLRITDRSGGTLGVPIDVGEYYRSGTTKEKIGELKINGEIILLQNPGDLGVGTVMNQPIFDTGTFTNVSGEMLRVYDSGQAVEYTQPVVTTNWNPAYVARLKADEAQSMKARVLAHQQKRAEQGYESDQYLLGMRYLTGDGVTPNRDLALHWLRAACTNGYTQASNTLAGIK